MIAGTSSTHFYQLDAQSAALACQGELRFHARADWFGMPSIYVEKRESQAAGFGTASTRKIVVKSLNQGFEGRFHNIASNSSHLFHLYMGMLPVKRTAVFKERYGMQGEYAVNDMQSLLDKIYLKEQLTEQEKRQLKLLQEILRDVKKLAPSEPVTDQMIEESQELITQYKNEVISSIETEFIPKILDVLEKQPKTKRPDTSSIGIVFMVLSDPGIERWKEAIHAEICFVPFKKFEHLHSFMTEDQQKRLEAIVKLRFQT